jgi:hypothetical protein
MVLINWFGLILNYGMHRINSGSDPLLTMCVSHALAFAPPSCDYGTVEEIQLMTFTLCIPSLLETMVITHLSTGLVPYTRDLGWPYLINLRTFKTTVPQCQLISFWLAFSLASDQCAQVALCWHSPKLGQKKSTGFLPEWNNYSCSAYGLFTCPSCCFWCEKCWKKITF